MPSSDAGTTPSLQPAVDTVHLAISGATNAGAGVAASGDRVVAASSTIVTLSDGDSASYPSIAATPTSIVTAWTRKSAGASDLVVRRIALQ